MINFFAFSGLLNFIVSFFLGLLVYLKGRKLLANKIFVLDTLSVALWSFGYFFWQISTNSDSALFWSRVLMGGAIFIPIFYFHFVLCFLNLVDKYKKLLYWEYGISILFLISDFTPYFVRSVEPTLFFPFWPKPGVLYHPFLLNWAGIVIFGWYLLLKHLGKIQEKVKKQQIKYFLLGTGIGFICGSTNYFLWYDIPIPPYLNIFVSIYVILTTFAILRYHLFEIRVILTELLIAAMGIILFVLPFLMPTMNLKVLTLGVFILFLIFARYLLKATYEESKRREEAEKLALREKALRKRAEKLAAEFERLDRAKTQFILATQHHLRTPLSIIKNYASMILDKDYGEINEKVERAVSIIFESTERLIKLVNEFLDISQFQVGRGVLKKEEVQIEQLIEEIVEELKPLAQKKGIYLKVEVFEKLPKIKLDRMKIKSAIFNVIDNAIKYTEEGGVKIRLKVVKGNLKVEVKKIRIEVEDTGIGMTQEEKETCFNLIFERGKEAQKLYTTGRGIGLWIAKNIIEAHDGKIWVESQGRGKGSTFYIELPVE